jgi:hypothetical protein
MLQVAFNVTHCYNSADLTHWPRHFLFILLCQNDFLFGKLLKLYISVSKNIICISFIFKNHSSSSVKE